MCMTVVQQSAATLGAFGVGFVVGAMIVIIGFASRTAVPADRSGRPS